MTLRVQDDHFLHRFDRYPEGEERLKALARHAAHLLNSIDERDEDEVNALTKIRHALISGVPSAKIALAIQGRLQEKFDTGSDLPTIDDLSA